MAAIALGYAMLLFVACLMEGLRQQMIENGTNLVFSQIQVHASGYYPNRSLQKTLGAGRGTDVSAILAAVTADHRVYAATPRVYGHGLASAAHQSGGVELMGVAPDQEQKVTVLHTRIVKGRYLNEWMPKGIVMGDKLATTIGVGVGSEIALLAQAADGSMGDDLYAVAGIFHTGLEPMDRGLVLMSLPSLQELLHLAPGRIHEVGIKLHDATEAVAVAGTLEAQLGKTLPVRVQAWPELAPELAAYVQFNRSVTVMLFFIFFLLAVMGIMNTMLMAVFERTRELGMLMGLGMRPVQVVGLVLAEATGLAVVSLVLGVALGAPLLWYLQVHGLELGGAANEISVAGVPVGHLWYGRQDFSAYSQAALGLAVAAVASALYPALRAAHYRPTEALRKA
jgi:ABC-type lipoprotein release transport system permease subunit